MMEMTKASSVYKWTQKGAGVIQSVIAILSSQLLTLFLSCWHWTTAFASNCYQTKNYSSTFIRGLENNIRYAWNIVYSTMTIEVISTLETSSTSELTDSTRQLQHESTVLPIFRLNSVTMEEYLAEATTNISFDEKAELAGSIDYSGQSDDCDSGLVMTDPDENELSSDDAAVTGILPSPRVSQEPYNNRRDSDSSDISSDGNDVTEKENKDIEDKLINQVESMFSDEYLAKDGFLLKHVRRRSDGFVSLKLVAGLRKVKQISRDFPTVLDSLRKSSKLEINAEGTKVRRMEALTPYLKALPTTGNKEKENKTANNNGASSDSAQDDRVTSTTRNGNNQNGYQQRRNQRSNSIVSIGSSNASSRNGSFSKPGHLHEPSYRNMMVYAPNETPQVIRRRGGSLPVPTVISAGGHQQYFQAPSQDRVEKRNSMFLSPNASLPDSSGFQQQRPKSNSYCEGSDRRNSNGGMSLWLQRRMESSRTSEASVTISGVIRQPRGPDGTKGFANGYRQFVNAM